MRTWGAVAAVLAALAGLAAFAFMPEGAPVAGAGQTQTIKGELVDLRCFLTAGKQGPEHAKCAMICAKDSLPVGLLTAEGKLYALVVQPAGFGDYMALQAEVAGVVRGEMIVPDSVKALRDGKWEEIKLPEQMM
ncbi:MAG TPA: hypothetical protein VGK94_12205 [Candidatus Polarisedimenticolia bacterium]|jgi:hypothetical protein